MARFWLDCCYTVMYITLWLIGVTFIASSAAPSAPSTASPPHDRAFWRSVVQSDYAPPPGTSIQDLATELSQLLASPDPEVRDELAYAILANWIYQKRLLQGEDLRPFTQQWMANLTEGIGSAENDTVFRRSFSALVLSVVVARDNASPLLESSAFRALLNAALKYLEAEHDLRGYDSRTGWMHSAAHTADLLKFLARSRFLERDDQSRILAGVGGKLRVASVVFTHGEDERFARALLSLIMRTDFDADGFRRWAEQIRPAPLTQRPDPGVLRGNQNLKNLFAKLHAVLTLMPAPTASVQSADDAVRAVLKDLF